MITDKTKPLDNPQYERMARGIAQGMTQKAAYIDAGYSDNAGNASALAHKAVIRNRVRELKFEFAEEDLQKKLEDSDEGVFTAVPTLQGQNGVLTQKDFKLTELWLVDVLRDNISGAQRDGKWKEANTAVQMLGNYMGGIFDPASDGGKEIKKEEEEEEKKKKPKLDITAIAKAMAEEEEE